jgi:hypothetical protein
MSLLAHASKRLHDELTEDYRDMIYAETAEEIKHRRKAFLRKWRLKCRAVADSLEGVRCSPRHTARQGGIMTQQSLPTIKAQARALRQALEAGGTSVSHAQAL